MTIGELRELLDSKDHIYIYNNMIMTYECIGDDTIKPFSNEFLEMEIHGMELDNSNNIICVYVKV